MSDVTVMSLMCLIRISHHIISHICLLLSYHLLFQRSGENVNVAIKMLQPVDPGKEVGTAEREHYKVSV